MKIDREWAIHESDIGCDGHYLFNTEIVRCKDCIHRYGQSQTVIARGEKEKRQKQRRNNYELHNIVSV